MYPDRQIPGQTPVEMTEAQLEQAVDERIKTTNDRYPGLEAILQGLQGLIIFNGLDRLERTLDTER